MWRDFLDGPVHKSFWLGVGAAVGGILTLVALRLLGFDW